MAQRFERIPDSNHLALFGQSHVDASSANPLSEVLCNLGCSEALNINLVLVKASFNIRWGVKRADIRPSPSAF
jgi:hypothetical protein